MSIDTQRLSSQAEVSSAQTAPKAASGQAFATHLEAEQDHASAATDAAAELAAARSSPRGHVHDGTPRWNPRTIGVLTGDDADAPIDTRSWEFADYQQVRGTRGREVRDVVGDDPWLWELADHSGMTHPASAVNAVIGQLAEEWAERVGYEPPAGPGGGGMGVATQYVRSPSGLEADHQRFGSGDQEPDLPPLGSLRTPGDLTPAPDPSGPTDESEGPAPATAAPLAGAAMPGTSDGTGSTDEPTTSTSQLEESTVSTVAQLRLQNPAAFERLEGAYADLIEQFADRYLDD